MDLVKFKNREFLLMIWNLLYYSWSHYYLENLLFYKKFQPSLTYSRKWIEFQHLVCYWDSINSFLVRIYLAASPRWHYRVQEGSKGISSTRRFIHRHTSSALESSNIHLAEGRYPGTGQTAFRENGRFRQTTMWKERDRDQENEKESSRVEASRGAKNKVKAKSVRI